jgi:hypothetical protein
MTRAIETIVVPSGTEKDDWARTRSAKDYAYHLENNLKKVKYII